jgi:hypothetical protein
VTTRSLNAREQADYDGLCREHGHSWAITVDTRGWHAHHHHTRAKVDAPTAPRLDAALLRATDRPDPGVDDGCSSGPRCVVPPTPNVGPYAPHYSSDGDL